MVAVRRHGLHGGRSLVIDVGCLRQCLVYIFSKEVEKTADAGITHKDTLLESSEGMN